MREPTMFNTHGRAPLPESPGCCELDPTCPDGPDDRSSQMLLCFVRSAPEIETPERAQPRDLPPPREAARRC
jgi:hypothetical protein